MYALVVYIHSVVGEALMVDLHLLAVIAPHCPLLIFVEAWSSCLALPSSHCPLPLPSLSYLSSLLWPPLLPFPPLPFLSQQQPAQAMHQPLSQQIPLTMERHIQQTNERLQVLCCLHKQTTFKM